MKKIFVLFIALFILNIESEAQIDPKKSVDNQQTLNRTDSKGKKQGVWKKNYPNGKLAYEFLFKDDKPVGTCKRYHENGKLNALLVYGKDGISSSVKIYNKDEILEAKGFYYDKKKDSVWVFLDRGKYIISEVKYRRGVKYGTEYKYYRDGHTAEERVWKNGVENGIWKQFYPDGKSQMEAKVVDGKLNGYYYQFASNGTIETKGHYKDDKKEGAWVYYFPKNKQEIEYVNGVAKNQNELDSLQNKQLEHLTNRKDKPVDPEKFRSNPYEYLRQVRQR